MNNEIIINADKRLTLAEYTPIASRTMSLIAEAAKGVYEIDEIFSVTDLSALLNKISMHMSGEFEIRQTPSDYRQIIYKPYPINIAEVDRVRIDSNFVDIHDAPENCLWVSEKVLFAFINQKLYGIAFVLYFYLGFLMTRDATFAVSHNISFKKIWDSCDELPAGSPVKHRTTLMRVIADLQDTGLIKWNAEAATFELLHITAYDPKQKV